MFINRSSGRAGNPVPRFLLGAFLGAAFVLSFAGAGLALSATGEGAFRPNFDQLQLGRVPAPALRLGA
jgi:hypothetical protein